MIRLHKFLEVVTSEYDENHTNQELKKIEGCPIDDSFCDAVEFCMLRGYTFDLTLSMLLSVDYNYKALKVGLDFMQMQTPFEKADWEKFYSNFPKQNRLEVLINNISYNFHSTIQRFKSCL